MRGEEIREGDIVEIDYITEFTKEHITDKALVIWKGISGNQPLVYKLSTHSIAWDVYEHISGIIGHAPIGVYFDNTLSLICKEWI